jgi:hypothetical protein
MILVNFKYYGYLGTKKGNTLKLMKFCWCSVVSDPKEDQLHPQIFVVELRIRQIFAHPFSRTAKFVERFLHDSYQV